MASIKLNARRALRPQASVPDGAPAIRRHHTMREDAHQRPPGKLRIPDVFLTNDSTPKGRPPPVVRSQSCRAPVQRSRSPQLLKSHELDSAYSSFHSLETSVARSGDSGTEEAKSAPPPAVLSNRRSLADTVDAKFDGRSEEELQSMVSALTGPFRSLGTFQSGNWTARSFSFSLRNFGPSLRPSEGPLFPLRPQQEKK